MTIGADILLDGTLVAVVPFEEPFELQPGDDHVLEVRLRGYMKHEETFVLTKGQNLELEIDLIAVEGVVLIDTQEILDATVEVDGQIIGSTPFDGLIPAGAHTLRVTKNGYIEDIREVRIQAGKRYILDIDLQEYAPPAPLAMPVVIMEEANPEFYNSWWFWTLTGVAVAGTAAAGVALGTQPPEETTPAFNHVIALPAFGARR